ncbi:MAG: FlgD immunoglobulin-like domain containing protein [Bacteroidota bacterium]
MRRPFAVLIMLAAFGISFHTTFEKRPSRIGGMAKKQTPGDWFWRQRSYPQGYIDPALRKRSLEQAAELKSTAERTGADVWTQKGPSNIGGRITTMAISQQNPNVIYAGAADGGVIKSTNAGVNWTHLSDDQPSLSMGAIAVDPFDDNIVYVGTGEANSSGDSYDGFGLLKSTNGGASWFHLGLEETRHIGKIVIDPLNTNNVYVAAMGTLFSGNPDRGVYKSTDAGATWSNVLFVNDSTGVVDIAIDLANPNILIAAAWQRMRGPQGRRFVGGIHTGIYRTTNAGATWQLLSNGLPAPAANIGRPGVAIAPSNSSVAYVAYADDPGNFIGAYKTTDGGDSWVRTNDGGLSGLYSNFGWYFGKVFVHPANENNAYVFGVSIGKTTDGGASWSTQSTTHADNHAMVFHPTDPAILYIGNDGGRAKSVNGSASWFREANQDLFITQFYAGYIDPLNPALSIGGTQDNGTPRTTTGNTNDWASINGGDGFYAVVDYTNSNNQYAESQYGAIRRTTNNWAGNLGGTSGISSADRKNWSTPIVIDPNNPAKLYTGTHRMYRTTNRAVSWVTISADLSKGPVSGFTAYATITTIDAATTDSNVVMAGTDDGNVWVTTNGGANWLKVSDSLPNRWVTRVRFDPTNHMIAYVTHSGYRIDSPLPYISRTSDLGASWQDISGNLPEAPINVVLVDPQHTDRLYIGTDVGCYFTTNTGATWQAMGSGFPNVAISDMQLHATTRIARAFTHGRSMWEIGLDQLTDIAETQTRPLEFTLSQNYPNPFNPSTAIPFALTRSSHTRLLIYDAAGRSVATLVDDVLPAGEHSVSWNARTSAGMPVSSGVYFYRLTVQGRHEIKKMILMR